MKKMTILCLGDSYTIGEAVPTVQNFPTQLQVILAAKGYEFATPQLIAKTGWTTDELMAAIADTKTKRKYDVVTLLVGVNNQYRSRTIENYLEEFNQLLQIAWKFAGKDSKRVFVVSIPDWGVTPFAKKDKRTARKISSEIDFFNAVNKSLSKSAGVHYLDITAHSRKAKMDKKLLAEDGLHPSGLMYKNWAKRLANAIGKELATSQ
jgi:lysophospholipase L1-like esterase